MNVLFLDSIEKKTYGGYQNWIRLVAKGLVEKGHGVFIAGRPGSEYLRRVGEGDARINRSPISISGDFNPFTIRKISRLIDDKNIDIVICDFNKDVRLGGLASRFSKRKPKVLWNLGLDITKNNFIHRNLTPRLVNAVAVPSEGLKKQVTRFGYIKPDEVKVIPHGIPYKEFKRPNSEAAGTLRDKYKLDQDAIVAVTSGRFVTQKGHVYLVDAAPEIIAAEPSIRFLWLGSGPLEKSLKKKIKILSVERCFVFAGMLDNTDLELAGSDLMIHPSIDEPFGFSIIEGMRAGLPVIATNVGGIPEVVRDGETGILINARIPGEIVSAVERLMDDKEYTLKMGLAGQARWKKEFNLEIMIDRWEKYLKAVANGRQP